MGWEQSAGAFCLVGWSAQRDGIWQETRGIFDKNKRNEETRVQGGKGEKQRYAEDKPDCAYCYFRKKKSTYRLKRCYYLLPEDAGKGAEESCEDCPYGKHSPCIGYCLLKIIREMKLKA